MNHKHIFGLIVRTGSVAAIMDGIWNLIASAQQVLALVLGKFGGGNGSAQWLAIYLFYGISFLLSGILALVFADALVNFAYRKETGRAVGVPPAIPSSKDDLLA